MGWNTIRLQKSMKHSSNIDPGAKRQQLRGNYREIVCKWGEISDQPFIFNGSSLHVQVLTVIFINLLPYRSFLNISLVSVDKFRIQSLLLNDAVILQHWEMYKEGACVYLYLQVGVHAYSSRLKKAVFSLIEGCAYTTNREEGKSSMSHRKRKHKSCNFSPSSILLR